MRHMENFESGEGMGRAVLIDDGSMDPGRIDLRAAPAAPSPTGKWNLPSRQRQPARWPQNLYSRKSKDVEGIII